MPKHHHTIGTCLMIYQDPMTGEKEEGEACILELGETDHHYRVCFLEDAEPDGDGIHSANSYWRWIYHKGLWLHPAEVDAE